MGPTIIHLIGNPGVGKYTVGVRVAELTGAKLVDNHAIANVIFNLLEQDGMKPLPPGVFDLVGRVRSAVLDTLTELSPRHLSFVFTNVIRGGDAAEYASFEEFVGVARIRGSVYVPVILTCETPELAGRIVSDDRRRRMKLIDPVEGARINREWPILSTPHPNALTLDVTRIPAEESARVIVEWAEECGGERPAAS